MGTLVAFLVRALALVAICGTAAAVMAVSLVKAAPAVPSTRSDSLPRVQRVQVPGDPAARHGRNLASIPATSPSSGDAGAQLAQCMRDWEAATHMTKQEWARTCRRVVDNRAKFIREQGTARELPNLPPAGLGSR